MSFCINCGNKLENDNFCPKCGFTTHQETTKDNKTQANQKSEFKRGKDLSNLENGFTLENGRYRIETNLGSWDLGTIYKAWDNDVEDWKFIKIIDPDYINDEILNGLKNEAKIWDKLQSDYVVKFLDVHFRSEIKFIDFDYVSGEDLIDIKLKNLDQRISNNIIFNIIKQISLGMIEINNQNIIHCNLRPANILVTNSGNVKILDFGISETFRSRINIIQKDKKHGKLVYMSPEQLRGEGIGTEANIWSFGVILYELLTSKPLFTGLSSADVLFQIENRVFEPIEFVSDKINNILLKCLIIEPEKRLKSFDSLLELLEAKDEETTDSYIYSSNTDFDNESSLKKYKNKIHFMVSIILLLAITIGINFSLQHKIMEDKNFVFVKGGTFQMGNDLDRSDNNPSHTVTLDDFYIGKYEVTLGEFKEFIESTNYETDVEKDDNIYMSNREWNENKAVTWRCDMKGNLRRPDEYNHPVIYISWNDAISYCNYKSKLDGYEPCYSGSGKKIKCDFTKNGYRLPTEAEWEFAAFGGVKRSAVSLPKEDVESDKRKNVGRSRKKSDKKTHPVGQGKENELGIFNIEGNVSEWCNDWFSYDEFKISNMNPTGPLKGSRRVYRGGSWNSRPNNFVLSERSRQEPISSSNERGFRLVRKIN
jgi:formylglycine-generating enzyme required for sulfatase activity